MSIERAWRSDCKLMIKRGDKRPLKFLGSVFLFLHLKSTNSLLDLSPFSWDSPPAFYFSPPSAGTSSLGQSPDPSDFVYTCTSLAALTSFCAPSSRPSASSWAARWQEFVLQCLLGGRTARWSPAKAGLRMALGSGGKWGAKPWIPRDTWQSSLSMLLWKLLAQIPKLHILYFGVFQSHFNLFLILEAVLFSKSTIITLLNRVSEHHNKIVLGKGWQPQLHKLWI